MPVNLTAPSPQSIHAVQGVRLGTAYRLESGEVVYVPESGAAAGAAAAAGAGDAGARPDPGR